MEGWGKIGVQRASVLYPNSCYNEPCYIEVQVYVVTRGVTGRLPRTNALNGKFPRKGRFHWKFTWKQEV